MESEPQLEDFIWLWKSDFSLVISGYDSVLHIPQGLGSIPDWGTNIPHAMEHGQKFKKKKRKKNH